MRFDPQAEVICDECGASEYWEANYVFTTIAGDEGHYDFSDRAFEKWADVNGWAVDGDRTYCPDCSES